MSEHPRRASIVSGYFNPFHQGHLDLFEQARARTGYLVVVVNNDTQQLLKKGRIIQAEDVRTRIVAALRVVDDAIVARESGPGIDETFDEIRRRYPDTELEFCNGGDRSPLGDGLPEAERAAAERNRIALVYGVGGESKADSSTRIQAELEAGA
jgi:glycerol-3-phosphate cytidylyltransferase/D-beta-D-heptose 7-phosphate kinase/D-beta-D-heptose 1-phosphate adenosyltransferase